MAGKEIELAGLVNFIAKARIPYIQAAENLQNKVLTLQRRP
jgi:hypothetical protein